jgi:uncharacterized protein YbjT (DUF2867 family)
VSRTILITGATGNVSGALLDALEGADLDLRALVRDESRVEDLEGRGVEPVIADLGDPASLPPAFEGIEDVWLLTATSPRSSEHSMNAVWAARQAGVERVVRMSAVGAAHDAPTRNGRLHALSDHELEYSGMRWTVLRPHFFMQNLLGMAEGIATDGAFYLNMGEGRLGMIDVRDIAELAARILRAEPDRHHGRIYTATGPEAISFAQVAEQLGRELGREVRYVPVADEAARQAMLDIGLSNWLVGLAVEYGQAYASGWGDITSTDFEDVVGRPPRGFAVFAADNAAAFLAPSGRAASVSADPGVISSAGVNG